MELAGVAAMRDRKLKRSRPQPAVGGMQIAALACLIIPAST